MAPELSLETHRHLTTLFPEELRPAAAEFLEEHCGQNLPFCDKYDAFQLERIRFSVLKLSGGSIEKLERAVSLAQKDWRDVLVAAEFANDPLAHKSWQPTS